MIALQNRSHPKFPKFHLIEGKDTMVLLIKHLESMYSENLEDLLVITFFCILNSFITPTIISLSSVS